ncbi:MAG: hypothetical protein MJZ11_04350 [Lachnospiraceae bacterium]|nr:hypothetical protein [Lachnospiraceae bacterium]
MESKSLIKTIIQNPIFTFISLAFSIFMVYAIYDLRVTNHGPFKVADGMSILLLAFTLIDVLFAYFDKTSTFKELIKETIPGYIFFIAFLISKYMLRG